MGVTRRTGQGKRALALDLGSSSVRAIVFEASGETPTGAAQLDAVSGATARRPRMLRGTLPGQATFDADDYLDDLIACIDELHGAGQLGGVTDVGVSCQWHSIAAIDRRGRPLGEVLSWADTRPRRLGASASTSSPEAASPGAVDLEQLRQRTGCAFAPMYWTWRAPWLAAAAGREVAWFCGLAEYVGLRLLGDPTMSVSMASGTGLLCTDECDWDAEALVLAATEPSFLPPLAPPGWAGRLTTDWARRWPDLAGAAWHPAVGDGAAANIGIGCDSPGRAAMTIGTSAAVRAVRQAPDISQLPAGLWRYCVDRERVVLGAAYSSGGQLYSWALSLWEGASAGSPGAPGEVRYGIAMPVVAGSEGLLVLPWHAGTRPPEPEVQGGQGCIVGLGLGHSGAHVVSAAVEAVCFQLASGLEALEAQSRGPLEVVVNGGAIERAPWWKLRLASTLGRALRFPAAPETTARGAAALALGLGLAVDGQDEVVEADPAQAAALAVARRRWDKWYRQLLPIAGAAGDGS